MFTNDERLELLQYLESVYNQMKSCIEKNRVLPQSITHNGDNVGTTIEIHKIYNQKEEMKPLDPELITRPHIVE